MKSVAPIVAPVVALAAVLFALPTQAQRTLDIRARTAGDLADLCGANPRDPQGDAKINYCHGFAQGAVDVALKQTGDKKPFCFPSPPPTRTATMGEFVSWVRALPEHRTPPAIEGLSMWGASLPASSCSRASASHSAAASWPSPSAPAITGAGANSTASSGRASQISLQREQRTLRPASPSFAGSMP